MILYYSDRRVRVYTRLYKHLCIHHLAHIFSTFSQLFAMLFYYRNHIFSNMCTSIVHTHWKWKLHNYSMQITIITIILDLWKCLVYGAEYCIKFATFYSLHSFFFCCFCCNFIYRTVLFYTVVKIVKYKKVGNQNSKQRLLFTKFIFIYFSS